MMFTLIVLRYVDVTGLNVLNLDGKSTIKVIEIVQRIVDDWKFALSVSRGYIKLVK